jgi:hypothetical protein
MIELVERDFCTPVKVYPGIKDVDIMDLLQILLRLLPIGVVLAGTTDVVYTQSYFQKETSVAEQRLSNTVESRPSRVPFPGSLASADGSNEIDKVKRLDVNQIR